MRRFLLAVLSLGALACGGDDAVGIEPFYLRARAPNEALGAGVPIVPGAVDRIDVVLDPANNGTFENLNYPPFEDGDVIVRRSAAGEYVISLGQGWIDRNRVTTDSWYVDVPLYVDGDPSLTAPDPDLYVRFIRFGELGEEEIGSVTRLAVPWPPDPGSTLTLQVTCRAGYDAEYTTATP